MKYKSENIFYYGVFYVKNKKHIISLGIVIILIITSLCSCKVVREDYVSIANTTGRTIKLTLWGSAEDQQILSEMIEKFKQSNSQNTYEISQKIIGEDKAQDEVKKDPVMAADVFAVAHDQLGKLVEDGLIYENTKYSEEIFKENTKGSVDACTYKGKLYGYPVSKKTYFLYYDKRIFSEDDVKSLDSMLSKPVESGVDRIGIDMADAYYTTSFFLTAGCNLFEEGYFDPEHISFDDEPGKEAVNYIKGLMARGVASISSEESDSRFAQGKLGAYISGDWKASSFKEKLGENYAVAPLPGVDMGSGEKHMVSFAGYNIYCISANTQEPLAAMSLANFLVNKENQEIRYKKRNLLPTNNELINDISNQQNDLARAAITQLNYSFVVPSTPQMCKFWAPMAAYSRDLFLNKISA